MKAIIICLIMVFSFLQEKKVHASEQASFLVSYNVLETASFFAINKIFVSNSEPNLIYLPFHFDMHAKINELLGINAAFVYRYEDYQDNGPLYSQSGSVRAKKIWTNHHELFALLGPRWSFFKTGLSGYYASIMGGIGTAFSNTYHSLNVLVEPEIGYVFLTKTPGLSLSLGLGMLFNVPVYENIDFQTPWAKGGMEYSLIGVLVHQCIPIINVGLGFNW